MLATHDFDILLKLYDLYGDKMDGIEIKFFSFSKKFVEKNKKHFLIKLRINHFINLMEEYVLVYFIL